MFVWDEHYVGWIVLWIIHQQYIQRLTAWHIDTWTCLFFACRFWIQTNESLCSPCSTKDHRWKSCYPHFIHHTWKKDYFIVLILNAARLIEWPSDGQGTGDPGQWSESKRHVSACVSWAPGPGSMSDVAAVKCLLWSSPHLSLLIYELQLKRPWII